MAGCNTICYVLGPNIHMYVLCSNSLYTLSTLLCVKRLSPLPLLGFKSVGIKLVVPNSYHPYVTIFFHVQMRAAQPNTPRVLRSPSALPSTCYCTMYQYVGFPLNLINKNRISSFIMISICEKYH